MPDDHGAHFYRCDFQEHTPRDPNWKGQRPKNAAERKTYAEQFIAACRERNLNAIAITDHHDLAMVDFIRAAAATEVGPGGSALPAKDRIAVFPGVELTLAVPCQAILILDATFPQDRFGDVLKALAAEPHNPDAEKLPPVTVLDIKSLNEVYETLNKRKWLRGHYILLPNVTDGGHKTFMRSGYHAKYRDMPCVGGYLDGGISKVGAGNRQIFAGDNKEYGNRPLALFQTSDSRSAKFEELGKHSTWVKWAEPTAEALRQACLARQSRLSQEKPRLPSVYISRLVVSNSKFLGPLDVYFNPQYNAIIGGRGTGKSTILDYLRWALCDQVANETDDDLANPSARRRQLVENTLVPFNGQVEVHFTINDIPHVVRRDAVADELLLKVGTDDYGRARESDLRNLLPVHAYSQKQLSSVSLRVDELTRFVTAPIKSRLDDIDRRIGQLSDRLRENYATLQRVRGLDGSIARLRLNERSLAEQAANIRASLTGLSDEDRSVLNAKPAVDRTQDVVINWKRDVDQVAVAGTTFLADIDRTVSAMAQPVDAPGGIRTLVENAGTEIGRLLSTLRSAISDGLSTFGDATTEGSAWRTRLNDVQQAIQEFDASYEDVKRRSSAHEAQLAELAAVEDRRRSANDLLQRQQRERSSLGDPQTEHSSLREAMVALYKERSELLATECQNITSLSGGRLRATLSRGKGLGAVAGRFRSLIQGSGVRGARIDALFARLQNELDSISTWEAVLSELEQLMQLGDVGEHTSEVTPILSRLDFPVADQMRIRRQITPDGWLDLALTPLNDEPVFEYESKENEFIAFSSASAGQQATTLLWILLGQTGAPLIIDQPEEDLDSQVVQDVVERVWEAKRARQILFASHNANLVVNGDAELVVACDYRRAGDQSGGKIKLEGAIDMPAIRDEITRVMEGGEKAFLLRKEKYGF